MNILLIGEFSNLHNTLKEGLIKNGHHVVLAGFDDGFKKYQVDFKFTKKWDSGIKKKLKVACYKLTYFDISSYLTYKFFKKNKHYFTNYDIVQLINENSFFCNAFFEKKILKYIFKHNKKVFLLSCGDDYINVKYNFENHTQNNIATPFMMGKIARKSFLGVLKFQSKEMKKLHEYIVQNIVGIIASDIDYHIPLIDHPKYLGMIPNPIQIDKLDYKPLEFAKPITIFLGINEQSYFKKGIDYFELALDFIEKKYGSQVQIIKVKNLPYSEYINFYDEAHLFMDQIFAKDQGYNALEAMAKGKVVFTGANHDFLKYYQLQKNEVAIEALPDVKDLIKNISYLLENKCKIKKISQNARIFIEKKHNYIKISEKYMDVWSRNLVK